MVILKRFTPNFVVYFFRDFNTERPIMGQLWVNLNKARCKHLKVISLFGFFSPINLITILRFECCFQSVEGKRKKKKCSVIYMSSSAFINILEGCLASPPSDPFSYCMPSVTSQRARNAQRKLVAYKAFTLKGKSSDKFSSVCKEKLQRL